MKIVKQALKLLRERRLAALIRKNNRLVFSFVLGAIIIDTIFIEINSDFIIFSILLILIFFTLVTKLKSKSIFLLCLALLSIMFVSYLINDTSVATEKAAVWLVLLLGFGVIKQWRE